MTPGQVDRVASLCPFAIAAGFVIGWLSNAVITAGMLIGLGAMGGSLDKWRTERGLWMLAGLFFSIFGLFYIAVLYHQVADIVVGRAPLAGWMAVDWAIGTAILGIMVRFLWSVIRLNRETAGDR
jgi:hypothetical protein